MANDWPDTTVWAVGHMEGNGDGDGTLCPQGGHGFLGLRFVTWGLHPAAAKIGQFTELHAVFLLYCLTLQNRCRRFCGYRQRSVSTRLKKRVFFSLQCVFIFKMLCKSSVLSNQILEVEQCVLWQLILLLTSYCNPQTINLFYLRVHCQEWLKEEVCTR